MQDWTPKDLEKHLEAGERVFLKVWKKGCGPCKMSTPAVERLEAKNDYGLTFGQIVADDYPEMYEITETDVLPAFFVFRDKKMAGKFIGFKGIAKLQQMLDEAFSDEKKSEDGES